MAGLTTLVLGLSRDPRPPASGHPAAVGLRLQHPIRPPAPPARAGGGFRPGADGGLAPHHPGHAAPGRGAPDLWLPAGVGAGTAHAGGRRPAAGAVPDRSGPGGCLVADAEPAPVDRALSARPLHRPHDLRRRLGGTGAPAPGPGLVYRLHHPRRVLRPGLERPGGLGLGLAPGAGHLGAGPPGDGDLGPAPARRSGKSLWGGDAAHLSGGHGAARRPPGLSCRLLHLLRLRLGPQCPALPSGAAGPGHR